MSKQATTFELANLLMSNQERATEFRNEVNWLLLQGGHQAVTLEKISIAVSRLDCFTVTSQQVADCIAGPAPAAVNLTEEVQGEDLISGADEPEVVVADVDWSANGANDYHDFDEDELESIVLTGEESRTDGITPPAIASRDDILVQLITSNPAKVTYAQIEQVMMDLGLDPAVHEDDYNWVLDRLDERDIVVVDVLDEGISSESDVIAALQENRAEIDKLLLRVLGHSPNGNSELLPAEEQLRLLEIVRLGQQAARQIDEDTSLEIKDELLAIVNRGKQAYDQLLTRNQRLVASVALQYGKQAGFLEIDDLMQEGSIGLSRAIDKFDFGAGTRLSTYAVWWVRQAITRAIADQDRTIRLPVHRIEAIRTCLRAVADAERNLNRSPSDIEIAGTMRLLSQTILDAVEQAQNQEQVFPYELQQQVDRAVKRVRYLRQLAAMNPISLDTPVGAENDDSVLGDFIPDERFVSPEQAAVASSLREELACLLNRLTAREKGVLIHRFGLNDSKPETLEEVGQKLGVTRERIRQIEAKALRKLRHPLRSRRLVDYIDFTPKPPEEPDGH